MIVLDASALARLVRADEITVKQGQQASAERSEDAAQ